MRGTTPRRSARPGSARSRGWGGACADPASWPPRHVGGDRGVAEDLRAVALVVHVGDAPGARLVVEDLSRVVGGLAGGSEIAEHVARLAVLTVRILVVVGRVAREPELAGVIAD